MSNQEFQRLADKVKWAKSEYLLRLEVAVNYVVDRLEEVFDYPVQAEASEMCDFRIKIYDVPSECLDCTSDAAYEIVDEMEKGTAITPSVCVISHEDTVTYYPHMLKKGIDQ